MENQNPIQNTPTQTPVQFVPPPPPEMVPNKTSEAHTLIAIILLFFIYPVGLIFMWVATKWPKWVKLLLSAPVILALIAIPIIILAAVPGTINQKNLSSQYKLSPSPTPIPVKMDGQRVVNEKGGYSFVLPEGWKAKNSSWSEADIIFGDSFLNDLGTGEIRVSKTDKTLSDIIAQKNEQYIYLESKPITVDNTPGHFQRLKSDLKKVDLDLRLQVVTVVKNGNQFTITLLSDEPKDIEKFQELLSTFKFTQ